MGWGRVAILTVACGVVLACGRTGLVPDDTTVPSPNSSASPNPSPTPPPSLLDDYGDGSDGDLDANGTDELPTSCTVLRAVAGTNEIVLESSAGIEDGTRLLLLQVQVAAFATSGDTAALDAAAINGAGRWLIVEANDQISTQGDGEHVGVEQDVTFAFETNVGTGAAASTVEPVMGSPPNRGFALISVRQCGPAARRRVGQSAQPVQAAP